jgi:hypothetical protein
VTVGADYDIGRLVPPTVGFGECFIQLFVDGGTLVMVAVGCAAPVIQLATGRRAKGQVATEVGVENDDQIADLLMLTRHGFPRGLESELHLTG